MRSIKSGLRRLFQLSDDFPAEAPDAVFVGVADDFEGADFAGVLHVGADACAGVIIPYSDDSEGLRGIIWEFAEVDDRGGLLSGHELDCDVQVLGYDFIDFSFDCSTCSAVGSASRM